MRTDERAVAESLLELAEEPYDPRDDSEAEDVGELDLSGSAASIQSLISSDSRDQHLAGQEIVENPDPVDPK
jgi:hypothetical protein